MKGCVLLGEGKTNLRLYPFPKEKEEDYDEEKTTL